jgi:alcohol dehydrogenase, propanol-preferring
MQAALSHKGAKESLSETRSMLGMVLHEPDTPLVLEELPDPIPGPSEIRIRVEACGVCRTDLLGPNAPNLAIGMRVGIPWLGSTCGTCAHCASGQENLCLTFAPMTTFF